MKELERWVRGVRHGERGSLSISAFSNAGIKLRRELLAMDCVSEGSDVTRGTGESSSMDGGMARTPRSGG